MEVDEGSDQKLDIYRHWMAAHAHLKNEFTEDEKYHNLMNWLKYLLYLLLILTDAEGMFMTFYLELCPVRCNLVLRRGIFLKISQKHLCKSDPEFAPKLY